MIEYALPALQADSLPLSYRASPQLQVKASIQNDLNNAESVLMCNSLTSKSLGRRGSREG